MPETLKKLREPAALAAVVYAGVVILAGIVNLLAPPGNGGSSVPFSDRAFEQSTVFLDLDIAVSVALAVYLANHVAPALEKARLITLAALVESGLAALFGVVTALASFGASGVDGESKLLKFLQAVGGGAVVGVAGLFVWLTWQTLAPAAPRPGAGAGQGGAFGGGWQGPGSGGSGGVGGAGGQQYGGQPVPPPGGFGWTPQQGGAPVGQSGPTAFGQQPGQPGAGQPGPGQSGGYGAQPGQAPGMPGAPVGGVPGAPQPFGADRTQLLPPVQGQQSAMPPQPGQPAFGQPQQQSQQLGQQTMISGPGLAGGGLSGSGAHQNQPPLPPTMQGYAAEPSPWSPGGPGAGAVGGGQHGAPQQGQPGQQQIPPARGEEPQDQRPGPFQIGDWRSE